MVTIGYDYSVNGTEMGVRAKYFYEEREKFIDFITNNLTPYLSEMYNIDFERSAFYGHSAGGVLSHNAAFTSDLYENQPFKYYKMCIRDSSLAYSIFSASILNSCTVFSLQRLILRAESARRSFKPNSVSTPLFAPLEHAEPLET